MAIPARERVRAHRARLRAQGSTRLSVFLDPEAHAVLGALRTLHPGKSIDDLINEVMTGRISLPGNESSAGIPLPGNDPGPPETTQALPGNTPSCRAELAAVGHRWRREGATLEAVAERFNQAGWTPDAVPKRAGTAPRSDASNRWTGKATSQLLTRDYPDRD
ncbi:hypothetical protein E4P82_20825 [Candidatus Competibacter phosphatis]|uniref:Uncharacterized protein n=1 Tax=Candidatus Competibacter phosphatis TaxID=221280 RepID=A0ABX1TPQ0_9GAMM|nr:hypothetical protein [Candidatus Competibacter phosphatis]NMQ21433.1 hypothetical protein [Candidatus Competibacter phosphatis]